MTIICPAILAKDQEEYKKQIETVKPFAERIQIDLKDNDFALGESILVNEVWLPDSIVCDIHIMYSRPQDHLQTLLKLKPNMVIVHAESTCDIPKFAADLREAGIKTGVAILQDTLIKDVAYIFPHVQHLLIFSGDLGHYGGTADLSLTSKIAEAKQAHKYLEIGWDGGVNAKNAADLAKAGVDVLDVGGAIQNSDNPEVAYATIKARLTDI
jgi:ribulose-phosphate 3-epimerase